MATSGTTNFTLELTDLAEEAFERCGTEMRSGYDLRTARRSLNLLLIDLNNRGLNLFSVDSGEIPLVVGQAEYELPADTVDLLDHVIRTYQGNYAMQTDLTITRISESTYATIPNKLTRGRPIQVWVQRIAPAPIIHVWPTPDPGIQYTFVYWRMRRLQDAGNGANTPDVVYRFLPVLAAGLAYYLGMKLPEAQPKLPILLAEYERVFADAAGEDREKAAIRLVPRRSYMGR